MEFNYTHSYSNEYFSTEIKGKTYLYLVQPCGPKKLEIMKKLLEWRRSGKSEEIGHKGGGNLRNIYGFKSTKTIIISKLNDENPSLLVELNKIDQLPEEIGNKEFIVIPENLHPFIKDNLLYFLTRAGINVGGDTSNLIKLNKSNRNLR